MDLLKLDINKIKNKYTRDDKTAVLLSRGYHTSVDEFRYDPVVIELLLQIEAGRGEEEDRFKRPKIESAIERLNKYVSKFQTDPTKRGRDLIWYNAVSVQWVPTGSFIQITRCADYGESIVSVQEDTWDQV